MSTLTFTDIHNLDIAQTFDCGQCFRFNKIAEGVYAGVIGDTYGELSMEGDTLIISDTDADSREMWYSFLALDEDYTAMAQDIFSHFGGDETIKKAYAVSSGIRILRQDKWEALCSFIISQNNNIPRIKSLIEKLSANYGERRITEGGKEYHSFPTANALYNAGEEAIFALKTGFRAKYIYDCVSRIEKGETDLEGLSELDFDSLLAELQKIKGVGLKVASCTALYGFHKLSAFPVDVWVKRIIAKYYPDGLDIANLGEYAGLAQQYLFNYERNVASKE